MHFDPGWNPDREARQLAVELMRHSQAPAGQCGLRFGDLSTAIDGWMLRVGSAIDQDAFVTQHVDVPHDLGSCGEVVATLLGHGSLRSRPVVVLAAHLDREPRRAFEETSAGPRTNVEGHVRAEGSAVRQVHQERGIVRVRPAGACASGVVAHGDEDLAGRAARQVARRRHHHQLPPDQLGLLVLRQAVKIIHGGHALRPHSQMLAPATDATALPT